VTKKKYAKKNKKRKTFLENLHIYITRVFVIFNMRNSLALDLGTRTGFCVFRLEGDNIEFLKSGTKNFSQPSKTHLGRRFVCFRDWLIRITKEYNIEKVFYEQVYGHTGIQASHVYGGFLYHMAAVCDDFKIPMYGICVGTIKKSVTGNGHASKDEVIQSVMKLNINPIDDNEADAVAIALTAKQMGEKE